VRRYWGSGGIAPRVLNLSARRRLVARFTYRPLYLRGKSPQYIFDRRLGVPQSRSGRGGEEKNICPAGNKSGRPARSSVTILTELPRFHAPPQSVFEAILRLSCTRYGCHGINGNPKFIHINCVSSISLAYVMRTSEMDQHLGNSSLFPSYFLSFSALLSLSRNILDKYYGS
jgi:hypothetical protein